MKKTYFKHFQFSDPITGKVSNTSARFAGMRMAGNSSFLERGDEGNDDDDDEEDELEGKPEQVRLLKKIKKSVSKSLATRATKDELNQIMEQLKFLTPDKDGKGGFPIEALRELADKDKGAMAVIAAQGLELKRLQETMAAQPKDMSIRSQCQAYLDANKDAIKKITSKEGRADLPAFEIKLDVRAAATSPMLPSTVMPGGSTYIARTEIQPGINELLRPEPTFWDFITKGTTSSETYVWLNKKPTDGAAGFIGPGVYKPAISFTVESELSHAKKIAVNEKMATELLEDVDGFTSWVETELRYQLMQKVNDTLQGAGAATSTVPAGLQTLSTAYDAATGVATTEPNFWDCVKAAVTMLRVKRFRGSIVAFVNPVDLANGVMTKAQTQGQLFIPPVTGATIVEDLNIPLGFIQVLAVNYYKILIYKAFRMAWGWENDDFTKNLVTVIGEMRLHQFNSEIYAGFAIYDSLVNITNAITKV